MCILYKVLRFFLYFISNGYKGCITKLITIENDGNVKSKKFNVQNTLLKKYFPNTGVLFTEVGTLIRGFKTPESRKVFLL